MSAWHGHDVPAVAALLAEDHADAWRQVSAWHRTADLLLYHADTLTDIRARMVAAWPPTRSPTSAAYVEHLDGLIASVGDTREAALANGSALAGILTTLENARTAVDAVNREWQWNVTAERRAGIPLPGGPHPPPDWREALNLRVSDRMAAVDQAIFEYTDRLSPVRPYRPADHGDGRPPARPRERPGGASTPVDTAPDRHAGGAPGHPSGAPAPPAGGSGGAAGALLLAAGPPGHGESRSDPARAAVAPRDPPRGDLPGGAPAVAPPPGARAVPDRDAPGRSPLPGRDATPPAGAGGAGRRPAHRPGPSGATGTGPEPSRQPPAPGHPAGEAPDGRVPPVAGIAGPGAAPTLAPRPPDRYRQAHRWPVVQGVDPVITGHRRRVCGDPGPGVIGMDR